MEPKKSPYSKIILSNKNNAGGIMLLDFKLLQGNSNQTAWYWYQIRYIDQWNKQRTQK